MDPQIIIIKEVVGTLSGRSDNSSTEIILFEKHGGKKRLAQRDISGNKFSF
jgi:hypothetical protein